MRSTEQYHKENNTNIARSSRGEGRSPWRTFIAVVIAVGAIASSPLAEPLAEVVDPPPPAVSCSIKSTFDANGVQRSREEVGCERDD